LALAAALSAQTELMPLSAVKAGMRGSGRTVFAGDRVEEFPVEILGILENSAPGQSLILGRLGGTEILRTGVMQGMSGSPVYIEGKLIGAVAMSFPFSKEPVAGIRPIEEMLRAGRSGTPRAQLDWSPSLQSLIPSVPPRPAVRFGEGSMVDIATPLGFSGFTQATMDSFAAQLSQLGLDPRQGFAAGGRIPAAMGDRSAIKPGSMISVMLISGDLNLGADGTVTHVDGNRIHAFGHRFLSSGSVEMPFARSEVITLLPTLSTSMKISSAREWMGAVTSDYSAGITGELGRAASMLPVTIQVAGARKYELNIVRDRLLSPFLLQMATFSAIDATERGSGAATIQVTGRITFGALPPVEIHNVYAADTGVPLMAALAGAVPLGYIQQNAFPQLEPKSVELVITPVEGKRSLQVGSLWASRKRARPGDAVEIFAELAGEAGADLRRSVLWRVPTGIEPGVLQLQLCDGMTANLADWAHLAGRPPSSAPAAIEFLNRLRPNDAAYLRILRPRPAYPVGGGLLPDPPASVALFFKQEPGAQPPMNAQSLVAEFRIEARSNSVSGARFASLEIIE
jgi:hypothetical protein